MNKRFETSQLVLLGLMTAILLLMAYTPLGYLNVGPLAITLNVIPVVGIYPILIFIGITITSQAFTSSHIKYVPAAIMAFLPHLADWSKNVADNAMGAAGTTAEMNHLDIVSSLYST